MALLLPWLSLGASALLAIACVALYLDGRGARKALATWQAVTDRRLATLEDAVLALSPSAPTPETTRERVTAFPRASFPPAPGGLPLRPVTLTRDDDPAHTRATVVAPPPPDSSVAPSTKPSTSRARPVPLAEQTARAFEARADARLEEISAELGPEGKAALRARIEAAEDARERARGEPATSPIAEEDGDRPTGEEHTRVMSAREVREAARERAAKRPPHPRPVPIPEARPTLIGGVLGGAERFTPTPTEPSAPTLDARIERLWHQKIAAAREAGEDADHCYGSRCFHEAPSVNACECRCDGCKRVTALLHQATREITRRG